jgi:hypothetical protein
MTTNVGSLSLSMWDLHDDILQAIISSRPTSDNDKYKVWSLRTIKRSKLTVRAFDNILHLKLTLKYSQYSAWRSGLCSTLKFTISDVVFKACIRWRSCVRPSVTQYQSLTIEHISFLKFFITGSRNPLSALQAHNSFRLASSHYVTLSQ